MEEQGLVPDKENEMGKIEFVGADVNSAVDGASAITVTTEWDEFKEYDYAKLRSMMDPARATMYDLRCYLQKEKMCGNFDRAFQLGVGWLQE